jgi:reverse transcriptase-like protein
VRYADDCNIYVRSQRAGERVMASIETFLAKRLKLKVNKAKSAVSKPSVRKFLGFRTATPRRRPGLGGKSRRQSTRPLAAQQQPRAHHRHANGLLRLTRPFLRRGAAVRLIRRTAGYGPVRPVVWEGCSREAAPYPDCAP